MTRRRVLVYGGRLAITLAALAVWQIASRGPSVRAGFSTPGDVLSTLGEWLSGGDGGSHWRDLAVTLQAAALAFLIGALLACTVALVLIQLPRLGRFLAPFLAVLNALPKVVFIPLFILWFGLGLESKLFFVGTGIFFIVFYNVYAGLAAIQEVHVHQLRVLGAGRLAMIRQLYIPATWGWLISSLRLSVAFALLGTVLSEMVASNRGIGFVLAQAQAALEPEDVLAGVFVVAVVAAVFDSGLAALDGRLRRWRVAG